MLATTWADVENVLRREVGTKESPAGSNLQKYGGWYGANGVYWCAIFQSWAWYSACHANGETSPLEGIQNAKGAAYCPYVEAWARKAGIWVDNPVEGALVLYDFDHTGESHHIGSVVSVQSAASFDAIEGNTSGESDANGGEVELRRRSNVSGYVRGFADMRRFLGTTPRPAPVVPAYPAWPGRVLTLTSPLTHGGDVKLAQTQLVRRGWHLAADGVYGRETDGIVRQFQAEKRLACDGDIGAVTWRALWVTAVTK